MATDRFCRMPLQVMGNRRLRTREWVVLHCLCSFANGRDWTLPVWPSLQTLAARTGYSRSEVSRATAVLKSEGIIKKEEERTSERSSRTLYYIQWDEPPPAPLDRVVVHGAQTEDQAAESVFVQGAPGLIAHGAQRVLAHGAPALFVEDAQENKSPPEVTIEENVGEADCSAVAPDFGSIFEGLTNRSRNAHADLIAEASAWYRGIGKGDSWIDDELGRTAAMALEREHGGSAAAALDAIRADGKAVWQAKVKADVNEALAAIIAAKRRAEDKRYGGRS